MTSGQWLKNKTFDETAKVVLCSGGGLWGRGWLQGSVLHNDNEYTDVSSPHQTNYHLKAESLFEMHLHSSDQWFSNFATQQGIFKVPYAQAIPHINYIRNSGSGTQALLFFRDPSEILVCNQAPQLLATLRVA